MPKKPSKWATTEKRSDYFNLLMGRCSRSVSSLHRWQSSSTYEDESSHHVVEAYLSQSWSSRPYLCLVSIGESQNKYEVINQDCWFLAYISLHYDRQNQPPHYAMEIKFGISITEHDTSEIPSREFFWFTWIDRLVNWISKDVSF